MSNRCLPKLVWKVDFPVCLISLIESSLFGSSEENKVFAAHAGPSVPVTHMGAKRNRQISVVRRLFIE